MCRSIKVLRTVEPPATQDDISAAALQFVRKVSGYRKPSRANEQVFNRAIIEIACSVEKLLSELDSSRKSSGLPGSPNRSQA
jgi:hypothetical protein